MSDLGKQLQGIATRVPINTNYVKIVCEKAADRLEHLEPFEAVSIALQKRVEELEESVTARDRQIQSMYKAQDKVDHLKAALKRLGSKESMTLQILVGNVERKFDYKKEYFTRIDASNEALK